MRSTDQPDGDRRAHEAVDAERACAIVAALAEPHGGAGLASAPGGPRRPRTMCNTLTTLRGVLRLAYDTMVEVELLLRQSARRPREAEPG